MFQKYIQPSIEILNIRIDEPITTVTDLILAAVCFYAFFRIRQMETTRKIKVYFKYYFLTLGLGAMFGGLIGHAFLYNFSESWKLVSWVFIMISVACIVHALVELARPLVKPGFTRLAVWLNVLFLAIALFFTIWTVAFSAVKFYTIFGLFCVVGSLSYYIYQKTGSRGVVRFMVAVILALTSAFFFSYEWGFSPWFNHNDIGHVILILSALIIYKGATLVLESPASFF